MARRGRRRRFGGVRRLKWCFFYFCSFLFFVLLNACTNRGLGVAAGFLRDNYYRVYTYKNERRRRAADAQRRGRNNYYYNIIVCSSRAYHGQRTFRR